MVRIHWVLGLGWVMVLMGIMVAILVDEVRSYPTFSSEYVCSPRPVSRYRRPHPRQRGCPTCYACKDGYCQFTGCKSSYDKIVENMALCVINSQDKRKVWCARLKNLGDHTSLRVGKSWELPLKNDSSVSGVGIQADKAKNIFIGLIDSQQIRFLIYNADTELVADLDLGSVDEKYSNCEVNGMRSGDEFCLVEVVPPKPNIQDNPHIVKCISTSKYVNATW